MREVLTEKEIEVLRCFADCNMKVAPTAVQLGCSDKTVHRTIIRVQKKTSFDPMDFWDLCVLMMKIDKED